MTTDAACRKAGSRCWSIAGTAVMLSNDAETAPLSAPRPGSPSPSCPSRRRHTAIAVAAAGPACPFDAGPTAQSP